MECPRCRAPNRDGAQFCRACGVRLDLVCAACGAVVQAASHFCDSCGATLPPSLPGRAL
ncbi:MAG: zinc ribbon domain-containing protein, partial [Candidatus Rokuibacteriota bacterium]